MAKLQHKSVQVISRIHLVMTEHKIVAEEALGHSLPAGAVVHHVNENRKDNRPCNLVICENEKYHKLLHRRLRVVKAGGDPDKQRMCCHCKAPRDFSLFTRDRRGPDGLAAYCRQCRSEIRPKKSEMPGHYPRGKWPRTTSGKWLEEYRHCGCTLVAHFRRDLPGYCGLHGNDALHAIKLDSPVRIGLG